MVRWGWTNRTGGSGRVLGMFPHGCDQHGEQGEGGREILGGDEKFAAGTHAAVADPMRQNPVEKMDEADRHGDGPDCDGWGFRR